MGELISVSMWRAWANRRLSEYEPVALLLFSFVAFFFASLLPPIFRLLHHPHSIKGALFSNAVAIVRLVPGVTGYIEREKGKVVDKLQSSVKSGRENWRTELPRAGLGIGVLEKLKFEKSKDVQWKGRCSGTVYIGGSESDGHFSLINEAYSMSTIVALKAIGFTQSWIQVIGSGSIKLAITGGISQHRVGKTRRIPICGFGNQQIGDSTGESCKFAHTNPLHLDIFPSIARFEGEVVAMTASILGSREKTSGGQICGNMSSGGTESILLAVKSSRDYMKEKKGIVKPEMIIPESAHSAYDKAAQYLNIKLWRVPVNGDFQADVKVIKRYVNKNTIMIVGSAPGFPHGIVDPIEELGDLALQFNICLHVDLCLGGFVLPFARKLGYPIPPFDFTVQGVTSISVDVHKYGLGPKGTSVVLYRNREIRKHQFVAVTEWSGGLYVSPSVAGSRPGGLVAGAWAAMMSVGEEGYLEATKKIMEVSKSIQQGIKQIPELFVLGRPDMTVIAFGSDEVDIFKVNDVMSLRGWHLNALQRPNSIHICLTLQHTVIAEDFLKDLKECVTAVQENPKAFEDGLAPIYGAAAKMPDRGTVQDLLIAYMDSTC